MTPSGDTPEQRARRQIDQQLEAAGWVVQDHTSRNLRAARGVAIREFPMKTGHGFVDYLLFVDEKAVGVLEAKSEGHTLSGVEAQVKKYTEGLPKDLTPPVRPLPFAYRSTGSEWQFTNLLDPEPRSRVLFRIHRPDTLAEWLDQKPLQTWIHGWKDAIPGGAEQVAELSAPDRPASFRTRLRAMPKLEQAFLYDNQVRAITNLEESLAHDRPKALIQMATGSGKTLTAITAVYRLIKYGGARRVLFLVDRSNLGKQAKIEFESYKTPDDGRKFSELYAVQHMTSNKIGDSTKLVVATIQRLYSMLRGDPDLDPELESGSQFGADGVADGEPMTVAYNAGLPPEYFDVIVIDECHRSIYSLWRDVLRYFDAFEIGLTATPSKHTFGYFNKNLVMEYRHEEAVSDGVNVDFEVFPIRTKITEQGATIDEGSQIGFRERATWKERWEEADEPLAYEAKDLDRAVVAKNQIRLVIETFRERLFTQMFPGRTIVPKTIIFAKDDRHAEDIVGVVKEVFGKGDEFCKKITYKVTGESPDTLIANFRTGFDPRIVVTVDMIATGTDIRPVEVVMFMRSVKSRLLFEQMKGRGVRICKEDELRAVSSDATAAKSHFWIVDAVGAVDTPLSETQPLERKKTESLKSLLDHVANGGKDPEVLSSIASRLARIDKQASAEDQVRLTEAAGGVTLKEISQGLVKAIDPDQQIAKAREQFEVPADQEPTEEQVEQAGVSLIQDATEVIVTKPDFRDGLIHLRRDRDQVIDEVSEDELLEAGPSVSAKEKAKSLVQSFEQFLEEHKDEIDALQFFYSQSHAKRLRYDDLEQLRDAISAPPRSWTTEKLWRAYELVEQDKVKGASAQRLLTDIVSLVRHAVTKEGELRPYAEAVEERFSHWMEQQRQSGREFTEEQERWLTMIKDHVATSLELEMDDFDEVPFVQAGGLGKAKQVFGKELGGLIDELNEVLVA